MKGSSVLSSHIIPSLGWPLKAVLTIYNDENLEAKDTQKKDNQRFGYIATLRITAMATARLHTHLSWFLKKIPGPGCSKLTMSLVNVPLNFLKLISQICQYFLLKKCEKLLHCKSFSHFFNKNISGLSYKVVKHLTS